MEDPFSVLSVFAPDPETRPRLVPLYPPLLATASQPQQLGPSNSASPQPQQLQSPESYPSTINVSFKYAPPTVPSYPSYTPGSKRRHWAISRSVIGRTKGKEREDDGEFNDGPAWQVPREPHGVDFGSFTALAAELSEEMRRRGITSGSAQEGEEQNVFDLLRESLDFEEFPNNPPVEDTQPALVNGHTMPANKYWTTQRATEAEEYIRDVVYGSVDGLAYVRSLAEFVSFDQEVRLLSDQSFSKQFTPFNLSYLLY